MCLQMWFRSYGALVHIRTRVYKHLAPTELLCLKRELLPNRTPTVREGLDNLDDVAGAFPYGRVSAWPSAAATSCACSAW